MNDVAGDLRHAFRSLRRTPGFAATVIAALALGIGANTAVFTVINSVLLRPLPYPESDRIVSISGPNGGRIQEALFTYLERNNPGLENLSGYHAGSGMNLNGGRRPLVIDSLQVSRNYFRLFGASPLLGRTFSAEEDQPGGPRVTVISYGLWQRSFAGDRSALGRTVTLGGAPFTVIGVLSPRFQPYPAADVFVPLQADPSGANPAGVLSVAARIAPGATIRQADARVVAAGHQFGFSRPSFRGDPKLVVHPLRMLLTGPVQPALWILFGAVALVLLIACANVANLLLVRASTRQRELAIRAAIGAGRARIVRQLLAESLLLAFCGGVLGLLAGSWGVQALLALVPSELPRIGELSGVPALDPRIAAFTALLSAATGILCGLVPAFQLAPDQLASALTQSGARSGSSRKQNRIRGALVVAEVGLSVVLLCGAVLLIRSFAAMYHTNLGLDPQNVLTLQVSLTGPAYAHAAKVDRLARQVVANVEHLPGIEAAAFSSALPLWGRMDMIFNIPGRPLPPGRRIAGDVQWVFVSPRFFDALRIPLLTGRRFREQEPGRTIIVNQTLARQYLRNTNPVGQRIFLGPGLGPGYEAGLAEIVGVVGDIREQMNGGPWATIYQPPSQIPDADMALVSNYQPGAILVRTRPGVPPLRVSRAVEQALLTGNSLPAAKVRTMEQAASDSIARQNFDRVLLELFAALALLLAAVGVYGVISYGVTRRTHEIGVRAALGAGRRDLVRLVLTQASRLALAGVAAGLAAAFGLTRLLRAELFGVTPRDPVTFTAVPLILLLVALAAAAFPAWRAARVDPLTALRVD